ncbi:MAG: UPF0236 family transposase-like protein, partial [Bacillota bacterium]
RERTVDTLVGTVTYRRRYYRDRETGAYTALLDEQLGLEKAERRNPGLTVAAVLQAVLGPSGYLDGSATSVYGSVTP